MGSAPRPCVFFGINRCAVIYTWYNVPGSSWLFFTLEEMLTWKTVVKERQTDRPSSKRSTDNNTTTAVLESCPHGQGGGRFCCAACCVKAREIRVKLDIIRSSVNLVYKRAVDRLDGQRSRCVREPPVLVRCCVSVVCVCVSVLLPAIICVCAIFVRFLFGFGGGGGGETFSESSEWDLLFFSFFISAYKNISIL